MNRREFLKCSLMTSLGAGIFGRPAKSLANPARPVKYVGIWRGGLGSALSLSVALRVGAHSRQRTKRVSIKDYALRRSAAFMISVTS
jgi:hypothetical protein